MTFTCEFCKKVEVPEANMICDDCAREEIAAGERDERYAAHYHEQQRIRYEGVQLFDNEVGKISVTFHRKVLRVWPYAFEANLFTPTQREVKLSAEGYIEGWVDAMAAFKDVIGGLK